MKVVFVGSDNPSIRRTELAMRPRWPDASFLVAPLPDEALTLIVTAAADLVVLFARGSQMSAARFCSEVRRFSDVPLVVIGDNDLEAAEALTTGADDFIRNSAEVAELVARLAASIRRAEVRGLSREDSILQCEEVLLNPATYEVFLGGNRVHLTGTEFHLLQLLIRNKGMVVPHRTIERALWGDHVDGTALLKKYIHRLRRKLAEESGAAQQYIRSVYGIGYLFVTSSEVQQRLAG